jgi:FAD/FMN-containing dehydrogenase
MTALLDQLKGIVGPKGWTSDPQDMEPLLEDWRGAYKGKTPIVVRPATTDEVVGVVRACADAGVAIVPQGGNTSLCGAGIPDTSGDQVLVSLSRMNRVRNVDAQNFSMEVEAGCILSIAQDAARDAGRFLPLSLSAEGSCQVGGNIATNAGGINVGRYGTARSLVLGLEVVLADGSVLNSLRALRKDTAGYDLKQLFIGSEGTLGIITAAVLRLYPDPGETTTALIGLETASQAVELLGKLKTALDDRIESFELVPARVFGIVAEHVPTAALPVDMDCPWYVLTESTTGGSSELLEQALMDEAEQGCILDAVVAKNDSEAEALWLARHSIAEAEKRMGKSLKHDISIPLSGMQEFLLRGDELLASLRPDLELIAFGHVGDANLHYNVILPLSLSDEEWRSEGLRITGALYDLVDNFGGSFSAEHGVGQSKKAWLGRYRGGTEFELMKTLKKTLDPANILNPGKLF